MKKIFEAIIPGWKGRHLPSSFPLHIRWLLNASVTLVHIASLVKYGKPFGRITHERRIIIIESLYNHPNATVRAIVQWWKLTALMLQC